RRRHTRFSRDWSSDVCSSDLATPPIFQRLISDKETLSYRPDAQMSERTVRISIELTIFYSSHEHRAPNDSNFSTKFSYPREICQIGRASCRERVSILVRARPL